MNDVIHKIKGYFGHAVPLEIPVKIQNDWDGWDIKTMDDFIYADAYTFFCLLNQGDIKLKLRPLESLTDDEMEKIYGCCPSNLVKTRDAIISHIKKRRYKSHELVEYLHSIHIDYQDLIGQGLAVELTNKGE